MDIGLEGHLIHIILPIIQKTNNGATNAKTSGE